MAQSKSSFGVLVANASNAIAMARHLRGSKDDPIQLSDSSDDEVS